MWSESMGGCGQSRGECGQSRGGCGQRVGEGVVREWGRVWLEKGRVVRKGVWLEKGRVRLERIVYSDTRSQLTWVTHFSGQSVFCSSCIHSCNPYSRSTQGWAPHTMATPTPQSPTS